ncbi:MAG TPA: gamma carbonic anhydrase family protein [Luteimonas sp.]|nr:gamma carbonic anhydrase family protein [Luteimonas sp.]
MDNIRPHLDRYPQLGPRVYVDRAATVIGDVALGADASLWPGVVVRGDVNFVRIGARSNIQDGCVVHVSHDGPHARLGGFATVIGDDVTVGHNAVIHACRLEDATLVGMGAIVLDGAVVKRHGFVGAGALVAPGKIVGEGEMWLGNPARRVRMLSEAEIEGLYYSAAHYVRLKDGYLAASVP